MKVVSNAAIKITAVSGVFDGGASELAIPEELAVVETLLTAGEEGAETGAIETVANAANKANHIFGEKKLAGHGLEDVLRSLVATRNKPSRLCRKQRQKQRVEPPVYFEKVVRVAGQDVTVRGNVINGAARISTAFIPK